MNQGSTVFAQFMSLIPRRQFNICVTRYNVNYRVRNLTCYDQFLVMSMAQYANKNSLRDIEASLTAISHKLYMSGINYAVPRNTLAKANELRIEMGTICKSAKSYPEELRMVTYEDFTTGNVYRFLTNHLGYEALTIAELYRERWNMELFFKWIKQHLHIKSFHGTSENAMYTQIWIAVCSFLLIALAKQKWNLDQSLYTISQTIGFVIFEKIPVNQLFIKSNNLVPADDYPNLFRFS